MLKVYLLPNVNLPISRTLQQPESKTVGGGKSAKRKITIEERERDVVYLLIFVVLVVSTLPHVYGFAAGSKIGAYIGSDYNIDDYCVYLSWLYQTAHGAFFIRNLFTIDPQPYLLYSFLISAMGLMIRLLHISLQMGIELTRVTGGGALLWTIYRFYCACMPGNRTARLTAFGFACLSSGFGWVVWRSWADRNNFGAPIDAWQPEAYTFTSIYVNFLFVVSTILIVGMLWGLLAALRTGRTRYAIGSGLCGFVLGNIHSYDILHVSAAWGLFLIIWTIIRKGRGIGRIWLHSALVLAMTIPTTYYIYFAYSHNPVFRSRADSPTLTQSPLEYVVGYGLVFVFVVVAAGVLISKIAQANNNHTDSPLLAAGTQFAIDTGWADRATLLFISCWSVAGLAATEMPFKFQRKMLMGEHIPLCLLAGWAAAVAFRRMNRKPRLALLATIVLASFISNGFVIRRDIMHIRQNHSETNQWPLLTKDFVQAADFIETQTPPGSAVLSFPNVACYLPGMTGRTVWAGHWSETPGFKQKMVDFGRFADSETSDADRIAFLRANPVQYLLYPNDIGVTRYTSRVGKVHSFADLSHEAPHYLQSVFQNNEYTLFKIALPQGD